MPELLESESNSNAESEAQADVLVRPDAVAPWPHTVFILAVLALWATYGALHSPAAMMERAPRIVIYLFQMVMMYLLVGSTIAGLYRRRQFLSGVFAGLRVGNIFSDVGRGFLVYLGGMGVVLFLGLLLRPTHLIHKQNAVSAIAPHRFFELPVWILVSITAGVCEEFLFRGYLLQQFRRWFGGIAPAIAASTLIFACMHFYEGSAAVIQIGGLGAFYAIIAVRRGNLRHVMIAHFFQDAITGVYLYLRLRS
jgi:membrane protease YdiL (CAAX protease family)